MNSPELGSARPDLPSSALTGLLGGVVAAFSSLGSSAGFSAGSSAGSAAGSSAGSSWSTPSVVSERSNSMNGFYCDSQQERQDGTNPLTIHLKE